MNHESIVKVFLILVGTALITILVTSIMTLSIVWKEDNHHDEELINLTNMIIPASITPLIATATPSQRARPIVGKNQQIDDNKTINRFGIALNLLPAHYWIIPDLVPTFFNIKSVEDFYMLDQETQENLRIFNYYVNEIARISRISSFKPNQKRASMWYVPKKGGGNILIRRQISGDQAQENKLQNLSIQSEEYDEEMDVSFPLSFSKMFEQIPDETRKHYLLTASYYLHRAIQSAELAGVKLNGEELEKYAEIQPSWSALRSRSDVGNGTTRKRPFKLRTGIPHWWPERGTA